MKLRSAFLVQISGSLINTLAFIVLTPILIHYLGVERYGVLLTVLGFVVFAGVAELGIAAAATRQIAADAGEARAAIFGAALSLSICFALFGGLLFMLLSVDEVSRALISNDGLRSELTNSRYSLFLIGFLSILSSVPKGALHGLSKFVSLNVISIFHTILSLCGPALYAYFVGRDLPGLLAITSVTYAVVGTLSFVLCLRAGLFPRLRDWSKIAPTLFFYGWWATISAIFHRLSVSLDRPLLSGLVGPSAVAFYVVPQSALERSQIVSGALLSVALPQLARNPNDAGTISLCYKATLLLSLFFVIGLIALFPILNLWLGSEFAQRSHTAAALLALGVWLDLLARVPYLMLQARSLLHREAKLSGLIALVSVLFLPVIILTFGIEGAALASILRSAAYLVLRLREAGLPKGVAGRMIWQSLAVALASLGSILYVQFDEGFYASALWIGALLLVTAGIRDLYPELKIQMKGILVSFGVK